MFVRGKTFLDLLKIKSPKNTPWSTNNQYTIHLICSKFQQRVTKMLVQYISRTKRQSSCTYSCPYNKRKPIATDWLNNNTDCKTLRL